MEKYLRHDPNSAGALLLKSNLYSLRGRHEEALLIADPVLKRAPDDESALTSKSYELFKLGRPLEALAAAESVQSRKDHRSTQALAAAIHYELAHYELAAQNARKATAQIGREELSNTRSGAVRLTLVAAEARLGQIARAKAALAEFNASVPEVQTTSAVKRWMRPAADLAGRESLFDGLRLAGVAD